MISTWSSTDAQSTSAPPGNSGRPGLSPEFKFESNAESATYDANFFVKDSSEDCGTGKRKYLSVR